MKIRVNELAGALVGPKHVLVIGVQCPYTSIRKIPSRRDFRCFVCLVDDFGNKHWPVGLDHDFFRAGIIVHDTAHSVVSDRCEIRFNQCILAWTVIDDKLKQAMCVCNEEENDGSVDEKQQPVFTLHGDWL